MKFDKHGIAKILRYKFTGIWVQEDTDLVLPILEEDLNETN